MTDAGPPPPKRAKFIARDQQRKLRLVRIGRCLEDKLLPEVCDLVKEYANEFDGIKLLTRPGDPVLRVGNPVFTSRLAVLDDGNLAFSSHTKVIVLDVNKAVPKFELLGHTSSVVAVVALKGNKLASGSTDETVRVWDAHSGECAFVLSGHESAVFTLTVLENGTLASSSKHHVHVWDLSSGSLLKRIQSHMTSEYTVVSLANGMLAVGGHPYGTVRVFDVASGAEVHRHCNLDTSLCLLPDGRLASAAYNGVVRLWQNMSGSKIEMVGHGSRVNVMIALSNDMLATGSNDFSVRVWNINNATCVHTLTGHTTPVVALILLPDGKLVSSAFDFMLKVWDWQTGECVRTIETESCIRHLAVLPGCKLVGSGRGNNTIYLWG